MKKEQRIIGKRICAFFLVVFMGLTQAVIVCNSICYASQDNSAEKNQDLKTDETSGNESQTTVTKKIKAEELDLGDYQSVMSIGEKQLLVVTVLPTDTTNQSLTYSSSNESVATINGLGRITAVSIGTTTITVKCGKVKESFELTVKKAESLEPETIPVTDIEISNYEEDLEVDKTVNLTATVLPSNATDSTVRFTSSNPAVATVNSSGEVKGISQGMVTITVKAGTIEKQVTLNVKVSAIQIEMNSTYLVLKPGEEFQLTAKAVPSEASQAITYKAKDETIASVTQTGKVTAKAKGNATIIVSNGDISNAVTVIVNETGKETDKNKKEKSNEKQKNKKIKYSESEKKLISLISKADSEIQIEAEEYKVITKSVLKNLYEKKAVLVISGSDYTITLKGNDIINYENELNTMIEFTNELNGKSFVLNENNNLPGNITLSLNAKNEKKQFLYLYNNSKNKYQMLGNEKQNKFQLEEPGKYLLLDKKLSNVKVKIIIVIIVIIILIAISAGYVAVKKQYWFW